MTGPLADVPTERLVSILKQRGYRVSIHRIDTESTRGKWFQINWHVPPATAEALANSGKTPDELSELSRDGLLQINGIGPNKARRLVDKQRRWKNTPISERKPFPSIAVFGDQ